MKNTLFCLPAICAALLGLSACHTEYDFAREAPERGTFGQEVYQELHKDARWSPRDPGPRLDLLERERQAMVTSLDLTVPEALLDPLDLLLRALAPLQDSDLLPDLTRKLAGVLRALAGQPQVQEALAVRGQRLNYTAPDVHGALLEHVASWEGLEDLTAYASRVVLANDSLDDQGRAVNGEPQTVTQLTALLSQTLRETEVTEDPQRLEALLADLTLRSDRRFGSGGNDPAWVVRLDARGLPLVRTNARGNLYSPFTDRDGDGLADVNELGQFVDFNGQALPVPAFGAPNESGLVVRDGLGRAVIQGEGFVFDYVDLNQTSAGFLLRQTPDFVRDDVIFDLLDALQVLLPSRVSLEQDGQLWQVYPAQNNPLVELLHAVVQLIDIEALDELLETSAVVMRDHDEVLAELLFSLEDLLDRADASPDLELTPGNTLGDDAIEALIPIVTKPGLVEDLLVAMQDPVVLASAEPLADMLDYKADRAVPAPNGPYNVCFRRCERDHESGTVDKVECVRACPNGDILVEPVDRSAGPGPGNRSHFERTLALFRTTSGTPYEMKVLELEISLIDLEVGVDSLLPPLLRIDDAAAAYIEAVAGDFELVNYITEEAVQSNTVNLLLDGLESICGSSLLDSLLQSLVPVLVNVTRLDLEHTCGRFEEVSARTDLSSDELKRHRLSVMVAFLSLLTDVAMDEKPSASQLARFFNTPNPSLDLSIARLSLSQIVDQDGYRLWESHGDMLYAAESTGLLDAMQPVFKVFSKHGMSSELGRLMAVLDQHYPTPEVRYLTSDGQPAPRAGRGTGLVRFEVALRDWLSDDRLFPALHRLAILSDQIESSRGRDMNQILAEVSVHALQQEPGLARRDGQSAHRRADGRTLPTNRLFLLFDALDELDARLEANPQAQAKWDSASSELLDLLLEIDKRETGEAYFVREGGIALGQFGAEVLADVVRTERDNGTLDRFIQRDLYPQAEELLTGRGLPLLVDLYNAGTASAEDRDRLRAAAQHLTAPQGQAALLVALYDLLADLGSEINLVILTHFLGDVLDPARSWDGVTAHPQPLLSHSMLLLRESMERDPDATLLEILRNALTRDPSLPSPQGDPAGAAPVELLGDILGDYNRVDPAAQGPFSTEDYAQASGDIADWLLDDRRGMEQIYDLVKSRKKESAQ